MSNIFTIDSTLRTITAPSTVPNIGVESDEAVTRLYFSMPRTYGEFDLSEFAIRINYLNADGDGDVYVVDDPVASNSEITFSWLLGRFVTVAKGRVRFIVCLKKIDETGEVIQEFNTVPLAMSVLEGLETTEAVIQENPDILEQILLRLDELENSTPENMESKDDRVTIVDEFSDNEHYPTAKAVYDAIDGMLLMTIENTGLVDFAYADENTIYVDKDGSIFLIPSTQASYGMIDELVLQNLENTGLVTLAYADENTVYVAKDGSIFLIPSMQSSYDMIDELVLRNLENTGLVILAYEDEDTAYVDENAALLLI